MKTTIDLPNPLLAEAKAEAARQGTTLRCLIEEGLRHILRESRKPAVPYRMRDGSVHGNGLTPEFEAKGGWSKIREAAYPGFFDNDGDDPDRGYGEVFRGPLGEKGYEDEAGAAEPARGDEQVVSRDGKDSAGQGERKASGKTPTKAPTKARQPKGGGQP